MFLKLTFTVVYPSMPTFSCTFENKEKKSLRLDSCFCLLEVDLLFRLCSRFQDCIIMFEKHMYELSFIYVLFIGATLGS